MNYYPTHAASFAFFLRWLMRRIFDIDLCYLQGVYAALTRNR